MYKYNLKVESGMHPDKVVNFAKPALLGKSVTVQPTIVDLRNKINIIYDQGQLGSCTANALCYSFIYNDYTHNPSRLFLYYNERMLDKNILNDAGSTLTQGINALIRYGVCSEQYCPYIISNFTKKPSSVAYTDGLKHTVLGSSRVLQTLDSLKGCLIAGYPFVVGIYVYSSFESDVVTNTGYVPLPNVNTEQLLGGHAVICVGYNDTNKVWIMRNSWGPNWGDRGNFYLPYNYLLNTSLSGDVWKITQVKVLPKNVKIKINQINQNTKHLGKY